MILHPANLRELTETLAALNTRDEKVASFDLAALNSVVEHTPEDMTATVQAGMTFADFQKQLARHGQWLALDPPHAAGASIGDVLATNASGPRRFGYGTIRDYLLGIQVALADGRLIRSGGKVVKNVAGYDLGKLFVGSRGSLGVIVEATFKLRPLPEAEQFVRADCSSLKQAGELLEAINESPITPVVLDLHNVFAAPDATRCQLVAGFAGTRAEVEWQMAEAHKLGLIAPGDLQHEENFWRLATEAPMHHLSILPSRLEEVLSSLGEILFVARAGNGVIHYRGGQPSPSSPSSLAVARRLKEAFDPKGILPELPA
ncbi:MAG: FAD-binding oxidoreductase [Verrucomicrobia bacterium]|nr:FAD-binding oxidoreductase [Verrucomicrobiota bacterium]